MHNQKAQYAAPARITIGDEPRGNFSEKQERPLLLADELSDRPSRRGRHGKQIGARAEDIRHITAFL